MEPLDHNNPTSIHTLGDHWEPDRGQKTELGELITRAKELNDAAAAAELANRMASWACNIELPAAPIVTAVAPNPSRPDRLAQILAAGVAEATGATLALSAVTRRYRTARLRDTAPPDRPQVADSAGYEVSSAVSGLAVVLVDDVILTGTTIRHVASLLLGAGASSVVGLTASRTRRQAAG